jgi:hypothetical protein
MNEQIERHMDFPKKDGSHKRSRYRDFLKKSKKREERRKAKLDPECQPTYKKYHGWEY